MKMKAHPSTNRTPSRILAPIGGFLHTRRDEAVRTEQMPFESLISEKSKLALLAVEWWPVVDHLGMDLHLVDPLHVVP